MRTGCFGTTSLRLEDSLSSFKTLHKTHLCDVLAFSFHSFYCFTIVLIHIAFIALFLFNCCLLLPLILLLLCIDTFSSCFNFLSFYLILYCCWFRQINVLTAVVLHYVCSICSFVFFTLNSFFALSFFVPPCSFQLVCSLSSFLLFVDAFFCLTSFTDCFQLPLFNVIVYSGLCLQLKLALFSCFSLRTHLSVF